MRERAGVCWSFESIIVGNKGHPVTLEAPQSPKARLGLYEGCRLARMRDASGTPSLTPGN